MSPLEFQNFVLAQFSLSLYIYARSFGRSVVWRLPDFHRLTTYYRMYIYFPDGSITPIEIEIETDRLP